MGNGLGLDTEERKIVERLVEKFGADTPIGDLLKIEDKTPIGDVVFEITGIYVYAYECTGNKMVKKGHY